MKRGLKHPSGGANDQLSLNFNSSTCNSECSDYRSLSWLAFASTLMFLSVFPLRDWPCSLAGICYYPTLSMPMAPSVAGPGFDQSCTACHLDSFGSTADPSAFGRKILRQIELLHGSRNTHVLTAPFLDVRAYGALAQHARHCRKQPLVCVGLGPSMGFLRLFLVAVC